MPMKGLRASDFSRISLSVSSNHGGKRPTH